MIIEKPSIEIENFDPIKAMKNIEKACRTCYRSEDKITEDSYKTLLKNCLARGHESVLEHEKITVELIADTGFLKDITRHRLASFSCESSRYNNYAKDKFKNQLHVIEPVFYDRSWIDAEYEGASFDDSQYKSSLWYKSMEDAEEFYNDMIKAGAIPDEARMILPHSLAVKMVMTANIREWKHILSLRTTKFAHPSVQQVMIPLLLYFKEKMPEIFDSVEYNTEFPKEKYAKISFIGE